MASTYPPSQATTTFHRPTYSTTSGDEVVLHHADHELQQLRIFSPQQYFLGALNTWRAPELFRPMPHITPLNINDDLLAAIPTTLR